EQAASKGYQTVVVVPVGFTVDNVEILYDIDIKAKKEASDLGMVLTRTETLNDSPLLIKALADIVSRQLSSS
ncbi:MAG: ferrochelatase, partial [Nitrososphaerales archaeon]